MPSRAEVGTRECWSPARDGRDGAHRTSDMTATAIHIDVEPAASVRKLCNRLAIVGGFDGTHVGGSLWRAATYLGINAAKFAVSDAGRAKRIVRAALRRF